MDEFEKRIHRTWVQLLVDTGYSEIAAIALDSATTANQGGSFDPGYYLGVFTITMPVSSYAYIVQNESIKKIMTRSLLSVIRGHYSPTLDEDQLEINYRIELIDVEEGWRNVTKNLIANAQNPNQATVTEIASARRGEQPYTYNEMKFGSKSEIRIAQELERRGILFFPLPLAVRAETGQHYKDHREPDFLICHNGVWGILEVARHSPDRYEKDDEKAAWFKKSGILCVEHRPAEKCYSESSTVVDEFLRILEQHRR